MAGPHAVVEVGHVEAVAHEDEVDAVGPAVALDERDRPGLGPVVGAHAVVRAGRAGGEEQGREGRGGNRRHHPDTSPTRANRTDPSGTATGRNNKSAATAAGTVNSTLAGEAPSRPVNAPSGPTASTM